MAADLMRWVSTTAAEAWHFAASDPAAAASFVSVAFCVVFTAASLGSFFVPWFFSFFFGVQDLKAKYGAEWAIVTGGTSGIGKAIARRLAAQGLNVVIAAYDDKLMEESRVSFPEEFPGCQFRFVAVDLSTADEQAYLAPIAAATDDIAVQVVFSNAGYIRTGLFDGSPLGVQLRNLRCNATSSAVVAHHFLRRMRRAGLRGCVVFTSSPANLTPCPLSAMYGATKSFLTELAVSVAPEVVEFGIDVAVLHPSPADTNFFNKADSIGALLFFKSTAASPDLIARTAFRLVGRRVVMDQGYYGPLMRMADKLVDQCAMAEIVRAQAPGMTDYKDLRAKASAAEAEEDKAAAEAEAPAPPETSQADNKRSSSARKRRLAQ